MFALVGVFYVRFMCSACVLRVLSLGLAEKEDDDEDDEEEEEGEEEGDSDDDEDDDSDSDNQIKYDDGEAVVTGRCCFDVIRC